MSCSTDSTKFKEREFNKLRKPLVTTHIASYKELKALVDIEFTTSPKKQVILTHRLHDNEVQSILEEGISEDDLKEIKGASLFEQVKFGIMHPYVAINRHDLKRVNFLARRWRSMGIEGEIAFYDLSTIIKKNILTEGRTIAKEDMGEKGYFNTFNHICAQALLTSIFSEKLADFIADVHELKRPFLIDSNFTEEQIQDINEGVVDNYVDLINNEWGQELGKLLKQKYRIDNTTTWTAPLLADYLNDVQAYFSWTLNLRFKGIRPDNEDIILFAKKINKVKHELDRIEF